MKRNSQKNRMIPCCSTLSHPCKIMANDLEAADTHVSELFDDSDSINIEYLNNLADAYRRGGGLGTRTSPA